MKALVNGHFIGQLCLIVTSSLALLAAERSFAKDDWLCTQESSQRRGGLVLACGVARSRDEADARARAFDNAQAEFRRVCDASDDCRGRASTLEPKRTSCSREASGEFACYRLLQVSLDRSPDGPSVSKPTTGRAPSQSDRPRLKQNMSKADVLSLLGSPSGEVASEYEADRAFLYFRGPACLVEQSECSVTLERDAVVDYRNFKPAFAEEIR